MPYSEKQKAYDRARRAAQLAAGFDRHAEYAAAHRVEARARARAWRAANKERSRATVKAYRKANPQKANEWSAAWKKRNPARVIVRLREWAKKDRAARPEVGREYAARRKAIKLKTQVEKIDFKKILRDSNGLCGICLKPFDLFGIHFDHKVPLARGGTHTTDNIQAAHARCNLMKGSKVG